MNQNSCFNRGFILDNFPKTQQQCIDLFTTKIEIKNEIKKETEGEEEIKDKEVEYQTVLNKTLAPQNFIVLTGTDADVLSRIKRVALEK